MDYNKEVINEIRKIDKLESCAGVTDKGTYKVHTDCYNAIKKESQKEKDKEIQHILENEI